VCGVFLGCSLVQRNERDGETLGQSRYGYRDRIVHRWVTGRYTYDQSRYDTILFYSGLLLVVVVSTTMRLSMSLLRHGLALFASAPLRLRVGTTTISLPNRHVRLNPVDHTPPTLMHASMCIHNLLLHRFCIAYCITNSFEDSTSFVDDDLYII
jgi:hypothetical protein